MKIAFMTIAKLHEPFGHPTVQGFVDRFPSVFSAADASDGFVARARLELGALAESWGACVAPRCHGGPEWSSQIAATLSIWNDLESVAAFAYHGAHGEAMHKRKEWFADTEAPTYAAWWVEDGHPVTWAEASERLDHLHENGPTPYAFDFTTAFDASGRRVKLSPAAVREKAAANAAI
jgi:hypothetical protein